MTTILLIQASVIAVYLAGLLIPSPAQSFFKSIGESEWLWVGSYYEGNGGGSENFKAKS